MWLCVLVLLSTPSISLFHPSPHLLKCCEEASQEFTSGSLKVRGFKRLPPLRGSWSWSHNISSGCSQLLILAHRGEKVKQTQEATINVCVCDALKLQWNIPLWLMLAGRETQRTSRESLARGAVFRRMIRVSINLWPTSFVCWCYKKLQEVLLLKFVFKRHKRKMPLISSHCGSCEHREHMQGCSGGTVGCNFHFLQVPSSPLSFHNPLTNYI